MFRALLIALLITMVTGSPVSREAVESSSPSSAPSSMKPDVAEKPTAEEPEKQPEEHMEESAPGQMNPTFPVMPSRPEFEQKRKMIFYDQRQSGKYNIRADLDNFMIMVIPSSPTSSASLLDFLMRGAMRRNQAKNAPKKKKKGTKIHKLSVVKNQAVDHHVEIAGPKDSPIHTIPPHQTAIVDHFIEGRTPYKVDISSTARTDPEAKIELIPSKIPVLRIVPPSEEEDTNSGNEYRSWVFPSDSFRIAKSLSTSAIDQLNIASNSVAAGLLPTHVPAPTDDEDVVLTGDTQNSFDSLTKDAYGVPDKQYNEDWEWKLLGAQEQCGPDRKRDSYGICQFVPT
ncbi:hypothetical protein DMENIID0001_106970 [Sergentomyia squamirostris]